MDMIVESFGSVLRSLREASNKTLKVVADEIGWSVVYVSDIERGKRNPPEAIKIRKIAKLLGVNACELIDLANKERKRVELDLEDKSNNIEKLALMLAREWDDITDDQADKIMIVLSIH